MCQYLNKFCHNLFETVLPLKDLTREDSEFVWSASHETAFNSAKNFIAFTTAFRYYDSNLPVTLQVDASDNAIGDVLLQEGKPVCFTSHTLNRNLREITPKSRKCLAIVSSMGSWHYYLYGKNEIIVHSDHQPLETIFKKPLSKTPRRLHRMILKLQNISSPFDTRKGEKFLWQTPLAWLSVNRFNLLNGYAGMRSVSLGISAKGSDAEADHS